MEKVNDEKFNRLYDFLVNETENPVTLHDKTKNQRLNDLLELFEYLLDTYDDNPFDSWFAQE